MSSIAPDKVILLVEDELNLAFNIRLNLEAEGYRVVHAADGVVALQMYAKHQNELALVILDVMLPELDGFYIAKTIRARDQRTAIIMLTARSTDEDRIRGLELGVDDYVKKPFHLQEFLLRVKRALQRSHWLGGAKAVMSKELVVGPFRLESDSLELTCPQGQFNLTALEADLLTEFMQHPNKVLSREYLLEKVWQSKPNIETRTIDNFIMRLRRYLEEDATHPQFLESVRGRGYRLKIETSVS